MIAENGLWFCDKCKSLLVEHESWFVEIASEHLCVCCAENEIVGLREQLRWRKWPDESPDSWRHYMVMTDLSWPVIAFYTGEYFRIHSEIVVGVTHWRPIGPLPGGD